jgi:hypothetical protein
VTSTTGEAGHPGIDEISALAEGLLSPSLTADIEKHLSECADCSDTHAALEEIRELLGTAPAPAPMPLDVAERIDAALAAEALRTALVSAPSTESGSTEEDPAAEDSAATEEDSAAFSNIEARVNSSGSLGASSSAGSVDHRSEQRVETRVSRETSSSDGSGTSGDRPAGHSRGATGPGRGGRDRQRRRRKAVAFGGVFTAVAIGVGAVLLQTMMNGSSGPSSANGGSTSGAHHAFSSGNLQGEVTTLLHDHPNPATTPATSGGATPSRSLDLGAPITPSPKGHVSKTASPLGSGTSVGIPACVRSGIGRREAPLAAERGTYEGTEAYLVLLPHATDNSKVSAYVVDASCADGPAAPLGTVLLSGSYPR